MYRKWQCTFIGVAMIDNNHLVMNVSEHVLSYLDEDKIPFMYIHHCNFLYDHKFDKCYELPHWIPLTG